MSDSQANNFEIKELLNLAQSYIQSQTEIQKTRKDGKDNISYRDASLLIVKNNWIDLIKLHISVGMQVVILNLQFSYLLVSAFPWS